MCAEFEDEPRDNTEIQVQDDIDEEFPDSRGEVEVMKSMRDPGNPTLEELEEHRTSHLPYRSWCRWCVLGRGRGRRHVAASASEIPIIGIDYFFITDGGVNSRKELAENPVFTADEAIDEARQTGQVVKCILVRDHSSKAIVAHVVPCKGRDEEGYVADLVSDDVSWLGYKNMTLKTDNEVALVSLVKEVIVAIHHRGSDEIKVKHETSAAYESQSNGGTEVGVRNVRGLFRTLKACLDEREWSITYHPPTRSFHGYSSIVVRCSTCE